MSIQNHVMTELIRDEFVAMLESAAFVDDIHYRSAISRPDLRDPVGHYVEIGWRIGIEPNPRFNGGFLRPFYEAAGLFEPPAYVWLELSALGLTPPANEFEAEHRAASLRGSSVFDLESYANRLPPGMDPVLHYAIVGEALGWRPSNRFDPGYYRECYPEVINAGLSPLHHYEHHGRVEGRRGVSVVDRLTFPALAPSDKPVVLVISHEASRTGAPILGWNLVRELSKSATVVSLMMRTGELENDFVAIAAASVGPLTWEDWNIADATRLAHRISSEYKPLYAIANSIETQIMVPALAGWGIPSVALVHEFAAYTRPSHKMRNVYDWANHVVFPAELVAQSSFSFFPGLEERPGIHILSQGPSDLPPAPPDQQQSRSDVHDLERQLRPEGQKNSFVVLGAGSVQIRKGVDLFISTAAAAKRLRPDIKFRFVWIGAGYDPDRDSGYSAYLAYQILQSDLGDSLIMLDSVVDLEPAYATADAFFVSSRLDPQPNVAIDAVLRGIPTVCFQGACGTAEILAADQATRSLVAAHLDVNDAVTILCKLADTRKKAKALRAEVARVGRAAYDMDAYVKRISEWGMSAAAAMRPEDLETLVSSQAVDIDMIAPPGVLLSGDIEAERRAIHQWSVMGTSQNPTINPQFRRPCAGFNPQSYAQAHPECAPGKAHPLAHWIRAGRPPGAWSRQVFNPDDGYLRPQKNASRVALHAHFYYEDLAEDFVRRIGRNRTSCDLFISTDTDAKAGRLKAAFGEHRGSVEIAVLPNSGRDIGPFLTEFLPKIADAGYDLVGHLHAKRSVGTDADMGEAWRRFLWENLLGGEHAMLDLAVAASSSQPAIGLLMAEDPHLVNWNGNRQIARDMAQQMGIETPLPDFFDFPLGTMFWSRPAALRPLLDLGLGWSDYPAEPVPYDGTMLHAVERLLPFVAEKAGFTVAGLRAPGTSW